ncbi:hypothetical protein A2U01_0051294, partial [Trifolium medium]|nr:hypothetical protein [Trifolium medium]
MQRGDVAKVKVATKTEKLIDSSMVVLVLGQKFTIRVVEDGGRWLEGGGRCCGSCPMVQEEVTSMASNEGGASFLATVDGGSHGAAMMVTQQKH